MRQAGQHSRVGQIRAAMSLACVLALSGPALSQEEAPAPHISIELNAMQELENTCRIVFLADNQLGADLDALSYETVLIDTDGVVYRLTLFDFQSLPEGRIRVRQFDLDNTRCDAIGQVLVNGTAACEGTGLAGNECIDNLSLSTRTETELNG